MQVETETGCGKIANQRINGREKAIVDKRKAAVAWSITHDLPTLVTYVTREQTCNPRRDLLQCYCDVTNILKNERRAEVGRRLKPKESRGCQRYHFY